MKPQFSKPLCTAALWTLQPPEQHLPLCPWRMSQPGTAGSPCSPDPWLGSQGSVPEPCCGQAGQCRVARMCHRCLALCCSITEWAHHCHSTQPGWHPAGQKPPVKSLGKSMGCHICSYQCATTILFPLGNKISQQYLKKKARKAESSHSDSRGNS